MENKKKINIKIGGSLDHNLRCSANLEYIEGSCLSMEELKALALTYNNALTNNEVKNEIKGDPIKLVNNKEFLLQELDNRFKKCNGQHLCWLKQDFIKATKDFNPDDFFRPVGTDGKTEWLSDLNIDEVMDQMEYKFTNFIFLGATPIDFKDINFNGINDIDFSKIMKEGNAKKNKAMIDYNLKKFYYKNILLIHEFNKFIKNPNRYVLQEFINYINKISEDNLKKDIDDFVKQFKSPKYQKEFINVINSEYTNLADDLYKNILDIKNKVYPVRYIGIIPNLDEHWKGGSHWVALFADLQKGSIYFFDSYGVRPDKRIREFVKLIAEWKYKSDTGKELEFDANDYMKGSKDLKKNKIEEKYDIRYNEIRNQFKGSECGVYSLNFIIRLLHNPDFDNIIKQQVPDDTINKCREIYFENQNINSEKFTIEDDGKRLKIKRTKNYVCE